MSLCRVLEGRLEFVHKRQDLGVKFLAEGSLTLQEMTWSLFPLRKKDLGGSFVGTASRLPKFLLVQPLTVSGSNRLRHQPKPVQWTNVDKAMEEECDGLKCFCWIQRQCKPVLLLCWKALKARANALGRLKLFIFVSWWAAFELGKAGRCLVSWCNSRATRVCAEEPQLFRLHLAGQNLISCLNEDKASW